METPAEIQQDTPDNAVDSEQNLSEEVEDREKAMKQSNKEVMNQTPPPREEPAGNAKQQPQRRLG